MFLFTGFLLFLFLIILLLFPLFLLKMSLFLFFLLVIPFVITFDTLLSWFETKYSRSLGPPRFQLRWGSAVAASTTEHCAITGLSEKSKKNVEK